MTDQAKMEKCARVMGVPLEWHCDFPFACIAGTSNLWEPHTDDGDSRRLEAACRKWLGSRVMDWKEDYMDRPLTLLGAVDAAYYYSDPHEAQHLQAIRDAVIELACAVDDAMGDNNAN